MELLSGATPFRQTIRILDNLIVDVSISRRVHDGEYTILFDSFSLELF